MKEGTWYVTLVGRETRESVLMASDLDKETAMNLVARHEAESIVAKVEEHVMFRMAYNPIIKDEQTFVKPLKGHSMFSGPVTIIGTRTAVYEDKEVEQYIYTIDGYEAKNGKPFVAMTCNIIIA